MILLVLLQLSIVAIALFVTYASVYGLGALFAAIAIPVMVAGTALEAGKYVAVSYAYKYWASLKKLEATLLLFFVALMMAFTSAGVFAYLGQGFQSSFQLLEQQQTQLAQLEKQQTAVTQRIASIDQQITQLPANVVRARIALMREYETEKAPLVKSLSETSAAILALKQTIGETEIHAGPITYIAEAFDVPVAKAATWIILALTLCLDPFAIFLSVLMNKILILRKGEKDTETVKDIHLPLAEAITEPDPAVSVYVPTDYQKSQMPTQVLQPPIVEPAALPDITSSVPDEPVEAVAVATSHLATVEATKSKAQPKLKLAESVPTLPKKRVRKTAKAVEKLTVPVKEADNLDASVNTTSDQDLALASAIENTNTVIRKGGLQRN